MNRAWLAILILAACCGTPALAQSARCKSSIAESARLSKLIFEAAEALKPCVTSGADKAPCVAELDRIKSIASTIGSQAEIQSRECAAPRRGTRSVPPEVIRPRTTP